MIKISTAQSRQFDLYTIKSATGNFSHDNKLGGGGFGEVYSIVILDGNAQNFVLFGLEIAAI